MLSGVLANTVSTQSEAVDSQRCGQAAFATIHVAHHQTKIFLSSANRQEHLQIYKKQTEAREDIYSDYVAFSLYHNLTIFQGVLTKNTPYKFCNYNKSLQFSVAGFIIYSNKQFIIVTCMAYQDVFNSKKPRSVSLS